MENVTLSVSLANAVLQYLATRPYQEVFQLIAALQQAAAEKPVEPESVA